MSRVLVALSLLALLGALLGCAGNSNENKNNGSGEGNGAGRLEKTKFGSCTGAPPVGSSILGRWKVVKAAGNLDIELLLDVKNNSIYSQATCVSATEDVVARIDIKTEVRADSLVLLESKQDEQSGREIRCQIGLKQGRVAYRLVGNCVELTYAEETIRLVRE